MTDRYGRAIISPSKPMDMESFATLYGGPTPPQIPVEAMDYLSRQWDNTGIGGRPETFFDRLKVQQQQAAISAMPRNAEGFIMAPGARNAEGFLTGGAPAPAPEQLATRAARGQVATLQNPVSPLIIDQGDEGLVKSQIGRGGSAAEKILLENTYGDKYSGFNWESRQGEKGFNYSGIKPIRAGDELLKNKAFIALQTRAPEEAAKVYRDLTGSDFAADLEEKTKQRTAMQRDYREGLRSGFIQGKMRRNPTGGWLERKVSEPDPLGIGPKKEVWVPAEPELQQADIDYGSEALGVNRNPTIIDKIPSEQRSLFFSEFQKHVSEGKSEREAAELAFQGVPGKNTASNTIATLQKAPVTPSKAGPAPQAPINVASLQNVRQIIQGGARNVHDEEYVKAIIDSTDPVELRKLGFDDIAQLVITNRLKGRVQNIGQEFSNIGANIGDWWARNVSEPAQSVVQDARELKNEVVRSIWNAPNTAAVALGRDKPFYDWLEAPTPEDLALERKRRMALPSKPMLQGMGG